MIQTYQTQSYQITYIKSFRIWNFNSTAVTFDLKKVSKNLWKLSWFPFWEKIYSSCLIVLHHLVKFACILFSQNTVDASKNCFFLCIQIFQCSWCPARKSWRGRDYYDLLCINECFFNEKKITFHFPGSCLLYFWYFHIVYNKRNYNQNYMPFCLFLVFLRRNVCPSVMKIEFRNRPDIHFPQQ